MAEVIALLERYPLTPNLASMRCVGYRQVLEYLVHIQHPIFNAAHLDKAQFYSAFAPVEDHAVILKTMNKQQQQRVRAMPVSEQPDAIACYQMQNKALYATRQLAKRQYTWLRKISQLSMQSPDLRTENVPAVKTCNTMAQAASYLY